METIISSLSGLLLLLAAILLWRGERVARGWHQGACLGRLEELSQTVESTQRDCLTSIDHLQRRLETLQSRASSVERAWGGLAELPDARSDEKYQAAALLLASGHAAERVAALLALPVRQIELVKELQKITRPAHAVAAPNSVSAASSRPRRAKKKSPSGATAKPARPILLTDVVRLDGTMADKAEAAA